MGVELVFDNGTACGAERDPSSGWYVLKANGRRPELGAVVTLDGIRREIVMVARVPGGDTGIHFVPDFEDPGCEDCARLPDPPTPEQCRRACGRLKAAHWY